MIVVQIVCLLCRPISEIEEYLYIEAVLVKLVFMSYVFFASYVPYYDLQSPVVF
jgi:hypothetical protein